RPRPQGADSFFFLVIAAATPDQDDSENHQQATVVLKEIIKATTHELTLLQRLFALSYEGRKKSVTERKTHGRKNLFH
ncbi:MAG: hypothetical protein IJN80_07390, partial [Clostridia bacterium]|nr:hypothetical protein [Clostridia bacterium]